MAIVTCHTPGCENAGIDVEAQLVTVIDGETFTSDVVVCGACGSEIVDITGDER